MCSIAAMASFVLKSTPKPVNLRGSSPCPMARPSRHASLKTYPSASRMRNGFAHRRDAEALKMLRTSAEPGAAEVPGELPGYLAYKPSFIYGMQAAGLAQRRTINYIFMRNASASDTLASPSRASPHTGSRAFITRMFCDGLGSAILGESERSSPMIRQSNRIVLVAPVGFGKFIQSDSRKRAPVVRRSGAESGLMEEPTCGLTVAAFLAPPPVQAFRRIWVRT